MAKRQINTNATGNISAQPHLHQHAREIQAYGTVSHALPLELEEPVRLEMTEQLNQLLADTITLRDLYKKSHWQVAGPTFYQLHLMWPRPHRSSVRLAAARRSPFNCHDCWMLIKCSSARAAWWLAVLPNSAMTAPMILLSAKCFAQTSFKSGF